MATQDAELRIVLWIQRSLSTPRLDRWVPIFGYLGKPQCYAAVALALGLLDAALALRLITLLAVADMTGHGIKAICRLPRPSRLDSVCIKALEHGSGFPSNHVLAAVVFSLGLASSIGTPQAVVIAAVWTILTGLSRLYLGVHFPRDVAAGLFVGLAILATAFFADHLLQRVMGPQWELGKLDLATTVATT